MDLFGEYFYRLFSVDIEADDYVETDRFLFCICVETVELQCPGMGHDHLLDRVSHLGCFVIRSVKRIDSDTGQDDAGLAVYICLNPACDLVDIIDT